MEKPIKETTERSNKEVFLDFLKEVTGYEHGLGRTIIDLRKKPDVVLQSYLNREGHYMSPFRILFAALSIWLFVNSFIIDWYALWYDMMKQYNDFLTDNVFHTSLERKIKRAHETEKMMRVFSTFMGDLFSRYYVPFVILVLPLSSWFAAKFCRRYGVTFRSILIATTYSVATSTAIYFLMSVGFAISKWATLGVIMVLMGFTLSGRNLMQLTQMRKFFPENGRKIEKRIKK